MGCDSEEKGEEEIAEDTCEATELQRERHEARLSLEFVCRFNFMASAFCVGPSILVS
jgi:hypothetical protein